jgi:hypothetical protein
MPTRGSIIIFSVVASGAMVAGSPTIPASAETTPKPIASAPFSETPVLGSYADAINALGDSSYPSLYAGDSENPDGSVTVYLGPGSDDTFMTALSALSSAGISGTINGTLPPTHIVQVPQSISTLDADSALLAKNRSTLAAEGDNAITWGPDPSKGKLDVQLSAAPPKIPVSNATPAATAGPTTSTALQNLVPNVQITSTDAQKNYQAYDRYDDTTPYWGGDDLQIPGGGECTAGFYWGAFGQTYMLTDSHCNQGNFTNNGQPYGYSAEWTYPGTGYDVQALLPASGEAFAPAVWGGPAGDDDPPAYNQGGPLANFPASGSGSTLTVDGAVSGEVNNVQVEAAGSGWCTYIYNYGGGLNVGTVCNLIIMSQFPVHNVTAGDSGGPIYYTGYFQSQGLITPAGLIEGYSADGTTSYGTFIGTDISALGL